jgi:Enoyl-(Acyl carrier protein) reductase
MFCLSLCVYVCVFRSVYLSVCVCVCVSLLFFSLSLLSLLSLPLSLSTLLSVSHALSHSPTLPLAHCQVLEIDTMGTFNMCKAALPALRRKAGEERCGSLILNVTATLHYVQAPYQLHASAAKAGVDQITRHLAAEWGKYGIRTVGIAPGPIADTEGLARLSAGVSHALTPHIPVGRVCVWFGLVLVVLVVPRIVGRWWHESLYHSPHTSP